MGTHGESGEANVAITLQGNISEQMAGRQLQSCIDNFTHNSYTSKSMAV